VSVAIDGQNQFGIGANNALGKHANTIFDGFHKLRLGSQVVFHQQAPLVVGVFLKFSAFEPEKGPRNIVNARSGCKKRREAHQQNHAQQDWQNHQDDFCADTHVAECKTEGENPQPGDFWNLISSAIVWISWPDSEINFATQIQDCLSGNFGPITQKLTSQKAGAARQLPSG